MRFILISAILLFTASIVLGQEAKNRWRKMNQIRNDKFDLVLPEVMRENNIDWGVGLMNMYTDMKRMAYVL